MDVEIINQSINLVGEGKIKEAIKILIGHFPKYKNQLIHVTGRLSSIEKEKNTGTIDSKDYILHENQIRNSLLNYIKEIEEDCKEVISKNKSEKQDNKSFLLSEVKNGNELLKMLRSSNLLIIDYDPVQLPKEIEVVSDIVSQLGDCLELFGIVDVSHQELLEIEIKFNSKINNLNEEGFLIFANVLTVLKLGLQPKMFVVKIVNRENNSIIKEDSSNKKFINAILK